MACKHQNKMCEPTPSTLAMTQAGSGPSTTSGSLPNAATEATAASVAGTTNGTHDNSQKDKPRWGKWTKEEETYTARLIADFTAGVLTDVDNGTTMRSWLSAKLRCCPMRISKKFVGEHSIGKRMFERNDAKIAGMTDADKALRTAELEVLHTEFCESWAREERERLEHQTNGTRKRKRNKHPKKPKPATAAPFPANMVAMAAKAKRPASPLAFKHPPRAMTTASTPLHMATKSQSLLQHQQSSRAPTVVSLAGGKSKPTLVASQGPAKPVQSTSQPTPLHVSRGTSKMLDLQDSLTTRSRHLSVDLTGGDVKSGGYELDFTVFAMDSPDASHLFDLMDTTEDAWLAGDHELDEDPFLSFDAAAELMLPPQVQIHFMNDKSNGTDVEDLALSPTSVMDMSGWPLTMEYYDPLFTHQY
ncbi:hypothetical protein DYB28_003780 [Aphanomyces astaci]|uniref:Uncharacterized protein n=1 Tax=Aphanomyces astaci TaxID=112090 RepID=A0A9X8EB03_APHAT|nr:hypothetical protein DYB28_003780 [Aphanomyces astaci]